MSRNGKQSSVAKICADIQATQRKRADIMKMRIRTMNGLKALVSRHLGYHSSMEERDREKKWKAAGEIIEKVESGGNGGELHPIILATLHSINEYLRNQDLYEDEMASLAEKLPVVEWAKQIRGFGKTSRLFLAIVVGETGDLSNYSNPGKVWKRMGCAPFQFDGKTAMGSTWRQGKEGKLTAEAWTEFGYSPRRRSIAYQIGLNMRNQNDGEYRKRYDTAKKKAKRKHKDWSDGRCDSHGMLLATKLLLKNLWIEWNGRPAGGAMKPTRGLPAHAHA